MFFFANYYYNPQSITRLLPFILLSTMSLLASRAVRVARTRLAHRNASTNHAGEHTNYPKEGQ